MNSTLSGKLGISVVIPVYNEINTIKELINRVKRVALDKEIIIVDDGSDDGTREYLESIKNDTELKVLLHKRNRGKGDALKTGFQCARGNIIIIQDADLEYDPEEYSKLIAPILKGDADVVYGSRFLGGPHRVHLFSHYLGNKLLTFCTNLLYDVNLDDMETCYKAFRRDVLKGIKLKSNGFDFEPEFSAKVCKGKFRIYETPISYSGRDYEQGKKITWQDGIIALWTLLKYRFVD